MAGVDLRTVQELLGHKTLEMTLRYSHLALAHKATAVARLTEALAPGPLNEPAAAAAGTSAPPPSAVDPERFRNVPTGRQSPAKRKYAESRRVGEWRRGGIEPRTTGTTSELRTEKNAHLPQSTIPEVPSLSHHFGHRVPKASTLPCQHHSVAHRSKSRRGRSHEDPAPGRRARSGGRGRIVRWTRPRTGRPYPYHCLHRHAGLRERQGLRHPHRQQRLRA